MNKEFIKKSSYLFLASSILVSAVTTTTNLPNSIVAKASEVTSIVQNTTLQDGLVTKSDYLSFSVRSPVENFVNGNAISTISTKFNNVTVTPTSSNHASEMKINTDRYNLQLKEGENTIELIAPKGTTTYKITKKEAATEEVIGSAVISIETFVLGVGYIVEPRRVAIKKDTTYEDLLENSGYELDYGEWGQNLTKKEGTIVLEGNLTLNEQLLEGLSSVWIGEPEFDYFDLSDGLGTDDFSFSDGWRITHNNTNLIPKNEDKLVYLKENDVIRTQFTFAKGQDLASNYESNIFVTVSRDEATRAIAYINSSAQKAMILSDATVKTAYDAVLAEIQQFGIEQNDLDGKVTALNEAVIAWATANSERQEAYQSDFTDAQLEIMDEKLQLLAEPVIDNIKELRETIVLNDKTAIAAARQLYDALPKDVQAKVTNYNKLIDAEVQYTNLVAAAKAAEIKVVIDAIENLPATILLTHKILIEEAREAYGELLAEQQKAVTNLMKLENAEKIIAELEVAAKENENINAVMQLITALPEPVVLTSKASIIAAREAYNNLFETQQRAVTNYAKLTTAEAELKVLEDKNTIPPTTNGTLTGATKTVSELITSLPVITKITLENGALIKATLQAFNTLSAAEQKNIPNAFTLQVAKAIYDDLVEQEDKRLAQKVVDKISVLPTISVVDISSESEINLTKTAYGQLTTAQKEFVSNYAIIAQLEAQIAQLKAAASSVQQAINALPITSQITETTRSTIEKARINYVALTAAQKKLVTNIAILDAAEQKLAEGQQETVKNLIKIMNDWPTIITQNEEEAIIQARKTYEKLTFTQQKNVTNYSVLQQAEIALAILVNKDKSLAANVVAMINDLPFTITYRDEAIIEKVRKTYLTLTASQKLFVTNSSTLENAEKDLLALIAADRQIAKTVTTTIGQLPTAAKVKLTNKMVVENVRALYTALTTTQKEYVDNYAILKAIEAAITKLEQKEAALKANEVEIDIPTVKNTMTKIEGYVTPGAKVIIYKGTKKITTASVDKDGFYTAKIPLQKKSTTLKFTIFNEIGDKLLSKNIKVKATTVQVATALKATPTKLTGKASANKTITIYKGLKKIKTVKVLSNGSFSTKLTKLKKGTKLKIIVSDIAGNKSKSKMIIIK